jgi:hypothetical protein
MKLKHAVMLAPALALGFLAVSAEAQQHKATKLGNPATRFAQKPPKKADDVRVILRSEKTKADVAEVLKQAGWKGSLEDFDRAAASADITEVQIAPGTRIPFMASRERNRKHTPHALMDVLWAGRKPVDAFAFNMTSGCVNYRIVMPKACGNFWFEETGKDTTSKECAPPPPPPVVSVSSPGEACVTQPVEIAVNVQNPPADGKVAVSVNGKELMAGALSGGTYRATFPGAKQPGTYEVTATSGGVTGRTSVTVKPCIPTCGITVTPNPAHAGKPITVDVSGSRVAAGVQGGIKTAKVEVVDPKGQVTGTYDLAAPNFVNNAVVIKKSGVHTLRAVVVDEAAQTSTNACQAQVDVKGGIPVFVGGYFGKERLTHDEASDHTDRVPFTEFSRCAPLAGFELGFQPKISDTAEFEAALGIKFPFGNDNNGNAHTAMFGNVAVNRLLSKGFFGGGVSWWDIGKDSTGVGLLLQGGFDLDKDGKWQFVGQTRVPFFNQFDNIENNYQFWGGFRFRPNSWK